MIKVGILGASGRMGLALLQEPKISEINLVACVCAEKDLINVSVQKFTGLSSINSNLRFESDINSLLKTNLIIDFSSALGTKNLVDLCRVKKYSGAILICTTGLSEELQNDIKSLSKYAKVGVISNTSLGIIAMRKAIVLIEKIMKNGNIKITETHHKNKKDSPSGTAISIGKLITETRNPKLRKELDSFNGDIKSSEAKNNIEFVSIREGENFGEHVVRFSCENEALEVKHSAFNRSCFAKNAWLLGMALLDQKLPCFFDDNNVYELLCP